MLFIPFEFLGVANKKQVENLDFEGFVFSFGVMITFPKLKQVPQESPIVLPAR
jgi:hypothetical protein